MQTRAFNVLLLTLAASEAGADRVYEWRSYFNVNNDHTAGATTNEIVFALDTEFYIAGAGEDVE